MGNEEAMEVKVAPVEGDLESVVEIGNGAIAMQEDPSPDGRIDTTQHHMELIDWQ